MPSCCGSGDARHPEQAERAAPSKRMISLRIGADPVNEPIVLNPYQLGQSLIEFAGILERAYNAGALTRDLSISIGDKKCSWVDVIEEIRRAAKVGIFFAGFFEPAVSNYEKTGQVSCC